jgi:MinD-like ATPase involved in chromosome partitioning or flagellar assembly
VSGVAAEVTGTVDPVSGALTITASNADPKQAQAVAKAYSQAYIDDIQSVVQAQIDKIGVVLSGVKSQILALQAQPTTALTTAQVTALEQTYGTLSAEQSNIQVGEPYAQIQVAADFPTSPTGLSKSKLGAIGLVAGLLVGCGIALARDQLDTRLRDSPDIEAVTESPILAELPEDSEVRSGKVAISLVQAPQSPMAESIRELRTSLRVILDDTPCPVIVVTSPEPGDGKTFVAANLAAAWALSGSQVYRPPVSPVWPISSGPTGRSRIPIIAPWHAGGRVLRIDPGNVAPRPTEGPLPTRPHAAPHRFPTICPWRHYWWKPAFSGSKCFRSVRSSTALASCSVAQACSPSSTSFPCWPTSSCLTPHRCWRCRTPPSLGAWPAGR